MGNSKKDLVNLQSLSLFLGICRTINVSHDLLCEQVDFYNESYELHMFSATTWTAKYVITADCLSV